MKLSDLAAQARRDPFILELDDGTSITIPQPSVDAWTKAIKLPSAGALAALAGDQGDALLAAVGPQPAPVLDALLGQLAEAFGMGNSQA